MGSTPVAQPVDRPPVDVDRVRLAFVIGKAIAHLPPGTRRRRLAHHLLRTAPANWRDYALDVGPSGEPWDHVWTRIGLVCIDAGLANDY